MASSSSTKSAMDNVCDVAPSALDQARQLEMPSREEMLRRDPSVSRFWATNDQLFEQAWSDWASEPEIASKLPPLDESLFDKKLRDAVAAAWENPDENESAVKDLWEEVAPNVYKCQFLDPGQLAKLRSYLEMASEADIPARPPYGIVLNRKGFMLDQRSVGYLAIPQFQKFYQNVLDTYMRPMARMLFPEYLLPHLDCESFGFSIQYQAGKDQSIRPHSDASSITLNFNLNLPAEGFSGSSLYFVDEETGRKHSVEFAPGVAVLHRGAIMHAALPIESGLRTNMVLWLFGKEGLMSRFPHQGKELTARERWTKPKPSTGPVDRWSPF